jgi:hypothetical protein
MSTAELTEIRVENVTDPVKPFTHIYHIRVPGYAQRTGRRLFLQPAFFQRGIPPLFSSSTRKFDVYFHYPWSEEDEVIFTLPEGFVLDNADAPAAFRAPQISEYKPSLAATKDGRTLVYKRNFYFGAGNNILVPASGYAPLKNFFDTVQKQDSHTVTLRQAAAGQ